MMLWMQVLSIDDDVLVPCGEVATAFAAWQRTADQMVGWFPRGHLLAADCTPRYLLRDAAVLLRGHYSMVLTKVCLAQLAPERTQPYCYYSGGLDDVQIDIDRVASLQIVLAD
jgi:Glycosyl transferase family 64 domain